MRTLISILFILMMYTEISNGQTTLTIQPNAAQGKDAMVYSCVPCGYAGNNYGNKKDADAMAWTNSGNFGISRALMQFDLTSIPSNAFITDARLTLYYNTTSIEGYHSGVNASYLQRIIAPWVESTVTWNNQPATTTANQILLPTSTSPTQNYLNINVTNFIRDMVINPGSNYGIMLKLVTETSFKKLIFASSDHITPALRPKLDITYTTPLPVELIRFGVKNEKNHNSIYWSTASEYNNSGFEIERSSTSVQGFEKIAFLPGTGNSTNIKNYEFDDYDVVPGISYMYRLKQIDFNGQPHYSEIIMVKATQTENHFSAGPNPFNQSCTISYYLPEKSPVRIEIFHLTGITLTLFESAAMNEGFHSYNLDPDIYNLPAGIIEIRVSMNNALIQKRLIYSP